MANEVNLPPSSIGAGDAGRSRGLYSFDKHPLAQRLPTTPTAVSTAGGARAATYNYLAVMRRYKRSITIVVLLSLAVALALSFAQPRVYRATSELLLSENPGGVVPGGVAAVPSDPSRLLANAIQVIKGPAVAAAVRTTLNAAAPNVGVTASTQADVIQISATAATPKRAATIANAYATAYITLQQKQSDDAVNVAKQRLRQEISDLQAQINASKGTDNSGLVAAESVFQQQLGQLEVSSATQGPGVRLLAPAMIPTSPAGPRPLPAALRGLIIGLILGIGLAFGRDFLHDSIVTMEEVASAVPDTPVVGLIPLYRRGSSGPYLVTSVQPRSPASEAYRTLRTALHFSGVDSPIRTLQITSPNLSEGKSSIVANLAVCLAESGQRVVVVCCDLRRPRIHEFFNLENDGGLTSLIAGRTTLERAARHIPGQPLLRVLPSGPLPRNPTELLSSMRVGKLFAAMRENCDVLLLDCPPVLPVADSLVLSAVADASLIVCRSGITRRKDLVRTVELLRQVEAPVTGIILNAAPPSASYGVGYRPDDKVRAR